jgi:hypothetical protein
VSQRIQTDDLVREEESREETAAGDEAEPTTQERGGTAGADALTPLFDGGRAEELRGSWQGLQSRFVDEPRETVQEADALVAEMLQEIARGFAEARSGLESQWSSGDDVSTEELRVTLQRYRSFFERLLAA